MSNVPSAHSRGKYWCFTLNNYNQNHEELLIELGDGTTNGVDYLVFGRERGDSGTPHLQGFIAFRNRKRFGVVRGVLPSGCHIELARGTPVQAAEYCKKEGDYNEYGTLPDRNRGVGTSFADYSGWVSEFYGTNQRAPSEREIAVAFPALFVRYSRALSILTGHLCPHPELEQRDLRGWQLDLSQELEEEPDDRTIIFYVDSDGGKGKSFFQRWLITNYPQKVQLLGAGKRDDIAHAVDVFKTIFLFNIPRGGIEYLQYTVLEQLKDRVVFSPKYNSVTKIIVKPCHVVVFCNEEPDRSKMSSDRFVIRII